MHINLRNMIYQPDGLVVDPFMMTVTELLESKLANGWDGFKSQYHGFDMIKKGHSNLFGDAQFSLVVPKGFRNGRSSGYPNLGYSFLPFDHDQFDAFIDDIYGAYSPDGKSATLADLLGYRDTKLGEIEVDIRRGRQLTPEEYQYMSGQRRVFPQTRVA